MIYTLTEKAAEDHPYIKDGKAAFYRFLFETLTGLSYDEHCENIDCTKITIAQNLQLMWYASADKQGIHRTDLTMELAISGPKVEYELENYQVNVPDGSITFKKNDEIIPFTASLHENPNMTALGITHTKPSTERMETMLQELIEYLCIGESSRNIIRTLDNIGFSKEELLWLCFSKNDIDEILTENNDA